MAWNTPAIPAWKNPTQQAQPGLYGPQQQATAYSANPVDTSGFQRIANQGYTDPGFQKQAGQSNQYGKSYLDQGLGMAQQVQNWGQDPSAMMAQWGANAYNPLDAYSNRQMSAGLGNLNANIGSAWQDAYSKMGGLSAAQNRSGLGVRGMDDPMGKMWQQGVQAQTGMASDNYAKMIAALNQSAGINAGAMGNYMGAYGNMAKGVMDTGNTQSAQALAALQAQQGANAQYQQGLSGEQQYNAGNYNTAQAAAQQQEAQRVAALKAQQQQQDQLMQQQMNFNANQNQPDPYGRIGNYQGLNQMYAPANMGGWQAPPQIQLKGTAGF